MRGTALILSTLLVGSLLFGQEAIYPKKTIYISATSKDNQPLKLRAEDCHAASGIKIGKVTSLGDSPISYIVALDTSNSTRAEFLATANVAKLLLNSLVQPGIDTGLLVTFDDTSQLSELVKDPAELLKGLDSLRPFGGSAIRDAMFISAQRLAKETQPDRPRVMFLISDGEDNHSKANSADTEAMLLGSGVHVYPILVSETLILSRGGKMLTEIARETGGVVLQPKRKGRYFDLEPAIRTLRGDFSSWYRVELELPSGEKPGSVHDIGLRCGDKKTQLRAAESYVTDN